jgi:Cu-Zn family superoxide dismutase
MGCRLARISLLLIDGAFNDAGRLASFRFDGRRRVAQGVVTLESRQTMKYRTMICDAASVAVALGLCGCKHESNDTDMAGPHGPAAHAAAKLEPASGSQVRGTVDFYQDAGGIRVDALITGLSPGMHGFHLHEKGDCSAPDAASAGGHFNPTAASHGGPDSPLRHLGDFGNLEADPSGNAHYSKVFPDLSFEGPNSIIDKAVIIHGNADDLKSQPAGNSGPRVACGVVQRQ